MTKKVAIILANEFEAYRIFKLKEALRTQALIL